MSMDPLEDYLRAAPLTNSQRADLWDAYHGAGNEDELASRLGGLSVPKEIKAKLWDLKASDAAAPAEVPEDTAPARIARAQAALDTPSMQAAAREADGHPYLREAASAVTGTVAGMAKQGWDAARALGGAALAAGRDAADTVGRAVANPLERVPVDPRTGTPVPEGPSRVGAMIDAGVGAVKANTAARVQAAADQVALMKARGISPADPRALVTPEGREAAAQLLHVVVPEKKLDVFDPETTPEAAGRELTNLALAAGPVKSLKAVESVTGLPATAPVTALAKGTENVSEWLARSAVKPMVSALKRVAGASTEGANVKAQQLVRFIIDNRLATAEQAGKIISDSERELQRVLALKNAPTDAATRAQRYLAVLEKNAAKAGLGADDVATFKAAARELVEGPMGEDATRPVMQPSKVLDASGQPVMVPGEETVRQLRAEVPAQEALESARASSHNQTRKAWGEQKGQSMEAAKAVERAQRDAVKAAVPEAAPILRRQGQAIQAREALDRMAFREANREPAGLAPQIMAGAEMAAGKLPVSGFAAELLRSGKLRGSFALDRMRQILEASVAAGNDAQTAWTLSRLGFDVAPDLTVRPAASPSVVVPMAPPLRRVASNNGGR